MKHLTGLIAAPFVPLHANGSLNLELIPGYYQFLKHNGIKGAFINGSTGEGASLSAKEKIAVNEAWALCTKGDTDFKVMTLVGGNSVTECIDIAQHAKEIGLYGISITSPSYFKPAHVSVLAEICMQVAGAVPDMPFYYYHIPVLTGVNFPMLELLQQLHGKLPNLAGIKYTHEDFMDYLSCLHFEKGHYDMLWGRDENMLSALILGAKGAVGSTFNYLAPLYHELMDAFKHREDDKAQELQQRSIDLIRLLGKYGGIATGKAYMKMVGMDCGGFRLPVRNMTEDAYLLFKAEAAQLLFGQYRSDFTAYRSHSSNV